MFPTARVAPLLALPPTRSIATRPALADVAKTFAGVAVAGLAFAIVCKVVERLALGGGDWSVASLLPAFDQWLGIAALATGLAVEACVVGWRGSSIRSLFVERLPSALSDLAYLVLFLVGGTPALMVIVALGLIGWSERWADSVVGLLPLREVSLWVEVPLLWFYMGFVGYWEHRLRHTRWFWPLHRSHHSPRELTLVNGWRSHPWEFALGAVVNVVALATPGFSSDALVLFGFYAAFQPLFLHSRMVRFAWLERLGICTPAGHRLHHGLGAQYHDRNFGEVTNLWDRLFGTYLAPGADVASVEIGVEAPADHHNTMHPFREIALQTVDWLQTVRDEVANLLPRSFHRAPRTPREMREPTGGVAAAGRERVISDVAL